MQSGSDQAARQPAPQGPPAIEIAGLSHWYGEGKMRRQVLEGVDLSITAGEVVLLTGPSGCGKTTLLTLVGALRQVQAGQVKVFGQELAGSSRAERQQLRRSIGMIFQGHNLLRCLSAEQNVQMGADLLAGLSYRARRDQAREWLRADPGDPAARSSEWRSPGPWPPGRGCCSPMNRQPPSTAAPAAMWWCCSTAWPKSRAAVC